MGSVDNFKRDPIYRKERSPITKHRRRSLQGGTDAQYFSPTGNVVDPTTAPTSACRIAPARPENLDANNVCRYDSNESILTSTNGADRISGLGIASFSRRRRSDRSPTSPTPRPRTVRLHRRPTTCRSDMDPAQILVVFDTPPSTIYIGEPFMRPARITNRTFELINTVVGAEGTTTVSTGRPTLAAAKARSPTRTATTWPQILLRRRPRRQIDPR